MKIFFGVVYHLRISHTCNNKLSLWWRQTYVGIKMTNSTAQHHTSSFRNSSKLTGWINTHLTTTRSPPACSVTAATVSICDNDLLFNVFKRKNKIWAMNNNCTTIPRHNKSFIHNINPVTWLKQWNYDDTLYLRGLLAGGRHYHTLLLRTR